MEIFSIVFALASVLGVIIYWIVRAIRSGRSSDGLRNYPNKNINKEKITSLSVHDPRAVNCSDKTAQRSKTNKEKEEKTMFCRFCGCEVPEKSAFCLCCGKKIDRPDSPKRGVANEPVKPIVITGANKKKAAERTMGTLKSIGGTMFGIAIFVGIIVAGILLFILGAGLAVAIAPFIIWIVGILFVLDLVLLLFAIMPRARGIAGLILYISSYVFGLSAWLYGLAVTLALWGWAAVIVGFFIVGVGVVPIGMLSAILNGHWDMFWTILIASALALGTRLLGGILAEESDV